MIETTEVRFATMQEFASRLKCLRKERDLTQHALAKAVGVERPTIGSYETGIRMPESKTLRSLADFFGVSMDYLVGRTSERTMTVKNPDLEHDHFSGGIQGPKESRQVPLHGLAYLFPPDVQEWIRSRESRDYVYLAKELQASKIPPETIRAVIYAIRKQIESDTGQDPI